ncbi:MAG: IclR family transcriptional regulator [Deltaproteobacteria bacterium]|nr:IclR family transcriptional regulator [Deltaproteobacteria bacterium]
MNRRKTSSNYTKTVPAVDQALKILFFMAKDKHPKLSLTEICKGVGIHKSKGFSILNTLAKYGLVQKDSEDKQYALGLGILSLSRKVLENLDYRRIAMPYLEKISNLTKATAIFGVILGEDLFVVAKKEPKSSVHITIRLGYRFHITHGAHGKAIAAFLEEKELLSLIKKRKTYFFGNQTVLDKDRLMSEIRECRKKGFAYDIGELHPGISAISSPVFDSKNTPIGVLIILGTLEKEKMEDFGRIVHEAARDFSLELGADLKKTYEKYANLARE